MDLQMRLFRIKNVEGEPIHVGDMVITPLAQVFSIATRYFDFTWNRPVQIRVQRTDEVQTIPIINMTRMALVSIYAFGAAIVVLLLLLNRK